MKNDSLAKAINTLTGIVTGITADGHISNDEINELSTWCILNDHVSGIYPFNEIINVIQKAYADGVLTEEERNTVLNHCDYLLRNSDAKCDFVSARTYELQGLLYGILADDVVTDKEVVELKNWMEENEDLCDRYPFKDIKHMLSSVMSDGTISEGEKEALQQLLAGFVDMEEILNF